MAAVCTWLIENKNSTTGKSFVLCVSFVECILLLYVHPLYFLNHLLTEITLSLTEREIAMDNFMGKLLLCH